MISSSTRIIALIGNPVRHSLSPKIQNYFISRYSKDAVYVAFEFKRENLKEAFKSVQKGLKDASEGKISKLNPDEL